MWPRPWGYGYSGCGLYGGYCRPYLAAGIGYPYYGGIAYPWYGGLYGYSYY